ncbi:cytochrome P450 [Hymenopellis radicata]|nr:cytochrome P450 [Hymenopellis radicata]
MASQSRAINFVLERSYVELAAGLLALRLLYLAITRLYFHPLSSYPGPKLAAITHFYQGYYDIVLDGGFMHHMQELHEKYGPIVRILPNELHFSNPEAYFAIYPSHTRFTKDEGFYGGFDAAEASFGLLDPQEHRKRRNILKPLFSRSAILKLEYMVQEKVDVLIDKLIGEYAAIRRPANLFKGFRAVTMDIISTYCYAHSFDGLSAPDFGHPILVSMEAIMPIATVAKHFPFLNYLNKLPPAVTELLNPAIAGVVQLRNFLGLQIDGVLKNPDSLNAVEHETIYHRLVTPELAKLKELPSKASLLQEARTKLNDDNRKLIFLVAGTDTTSNAMTVGFFHILKTPSMRKALQAELNAAWPDRDMPFTYEMAEKLPYLTGAIKESLRLSMGVLVPLPRLVINGVVEIEGKILPPGVVVGQAPLFVLKNQTLFPDPDIFKPERWMQPDSKSLERYLIVFSRGPRSCIGINLAWCELYLMFAHLFRKLDMELFETSEKDMDFRFHAVPVWRGRPLRASIHERM